MQRRNFIKQLSIATMSAITLSNLKTAVSSIGGEKIKMPVLFIGHGSPMNAIEDNIYTEGWKSIAGNLPLPKAILCISAHWQTKGTQVTFMEKPETIHDFGGFPEKLFQTQYPAPGSPEYAGKTINAIHKTTVAKNMDWGLDHGTWSILLPMFPKANIPVFQLSMDYTQPPQYHYELAAELKALREEGVLIVGSGNIVHNLGMMRLDNKAYDWNKEFDSTIRKYISVGDHKSIINYDKLGQVAKLAVPTNEHYLPLLYALGASEKAEAFSFYNEDSQLGSVSMTSVKIG